MEKNIIVNKLMEAKKAYYNSNPIMTDAEFDELEDALKTLDPNNDYFNIVGIETQGTKIKHKYPMLSMDKAKNIEELLDWHRRVLAKYKISNYIVEPKIDGLSGSIVYDINGNLSYIATRGDGKEGQNITHIAKYIKSIPEKIVNTSNTSIEIRGEFYLPKNSKIKVTSLRNGVAGLINRKKEDLDDLKQVKFIAYQVIDRKFIYEEDKLDLIKFLGFETPIWHKVGKIESIEEIYTEFLETGKDELLYEVDGLIIIVNDCNLHNEINSNYEINHHNFFNIALKGIEEKANTKFIGLEWNVSRLGNVIPTAIFESVFIKSANLQRASLSNYETVKTMNICKGDTIEVARAGDVIPHINKIIKSNNKGKCDDLIPSLCPSCNAKLQIEGVHLKCNNKNCKEQHIQKLIFWVKQNNFDGISEQTIRTLYNSNVITSIKELYDFTDDTVKQGDCLNIGGFGSKTVNKLVEEIKKSKTMTAPQFVSRLGIPLTGKRGVKNLEIKTLNDFLNFNDDKYVMGQNIIKWKNENKEFLEELLKVLDVKDEQKNEQGENKMKVAMTGTGPEKRDVLIKKIETMGYEFDSSVTGNTQILVCEDVNGDSTKLKKAKAKGIKLVSYDEFFKGE